MFSDGSRAEKPHGDSKEGKSFYKVQSKGAASITVRLFILSMKQNSCFSTKAPQYSNHRNGERREVVRNQLKVCLQTFRREFKEPSTALKVKSLGGYKRQPIL